MTEIEWRPERSATGAEGQVAALHIDSPHSILQQTREGEYQNSLVLCREVGLNKCSFENVRYTRMIDNKPSLRYDYPG